MYNFNWGGIVVWPPSHLWCKQIDEPFLVWRRCNLPPVTIPSGPTTTYEVWRRRRALAIIPYGMTVYYSLQWNSQLWSDEWPKGIEPLYFPRKSLAKWGASKKYSPPPRSMCSKTRLNNLTVFRAWFFRTIIVHPLWSWRYRSLGAVDCQATLLAGTLAGLWQPAPLTSGTAVQPKNAFTVWNLTKRKGEKSL